MYSPDLASYCLPPRPANSAPDLIHSYNIYYQLGDVSNIPPVV